MFPLNSWRKQLGIMGETGAGKTSVIHVLQRFYDVTGGKILLDGKDIRTLPLRQLRRSISLVMQDVFLFSDTVEENVRFGKRGEVPQEEVIASLDCAEAKNFVERMESQYDTLIGERGVGLSGGQKQRISIARALAKTPRYLSWMTRLLRLIWIRTADPGKSA